MSSTNAVWQIYSLPLPSRQQVANCPPLGRLAAVGGGWVCPPAPHTRLASCRTCRLTEPYQYAREVPATAEMVPEVQVAQMPPSPATARCLFRRYAAREPCGSRAFATSRRVLSPNAVRALKRVLPAAMFTSTIGRVAGYHVSLFIQCRGQAPALFMSRWRATNLYSRCTRRPRL